MPYQVNTNIAALTAYNSLGIHQNKATAAIARVSSGLKAAGGFDVSGAAMANAIRGNYQGTQNAINQVQNTISALRAADSVYAGLIALGQQGAEVASRQDDPLAIADADVLAAVTAQLGGIADAVEFMEGTTYNGLVILGESDYDDIWVDGEGTGLGAYSPPLSAASSLTDASTADDFVTYVTGIIEDRATNAGNLTALTNLLQVLNSTAANELAGVSLNEDADIAKEMMSLTSANILTEAATAMLAQAMQLPNSVLKLLQ